MKIRLDVLIDVDDGFVIGNCCKCPIVIVGYSYYPSGGERTYRCPLGYNPLTCPLKMTDTNKPEPNAED